MNYVMSRRQSKNFKLQYVDKPIYIFCGGEKTEPNYFASFKALIQSNAVYRNAVRIEIIPEPTDPRNIFKAAEKFVADNKIERGEIWCVFDKDDFLAQDFNNTIKRAEEKNKDDNGQVKYYIAWSNECFELWFLLHFCYYAADNGRADYIDKLNEHLSKNGKGRYSKTSEDMFNLLLEIGDPRSAIVYSKKLMSIHAGKTPADSVPCTNVHSLVESLAKYLPENINEKFL